MKKLRIDVEKIVKELEVFAREMVTTRIVGRYKSVFKGKGLEFYDYRDYDIQDDASLIDWKASMRINKLVIKRFRERRNVKIFILMDTSQSMLFGSTPKLKSEYAAEIAASFTYLIQRSGDSTGYAIFNDKILKFRVPAAGMERFSVFLRDISDLANWGGTGFKFKDALDFIFNLIEEDSIVIIVSDFIGLEKEKNWQEKMKLCIKKFDTIALMIRDERDETLPKEDIEITIQDPYSNKLLFINSNLLSRKYQKYVKGKEEELRKIFEKTGADFVKLRTDQPFIPILINLLKKRARRLKLY